MLDSNGYLQVFYNINCLYEWPKTFDKDNPECDEIIWVRKSALAWESFEEILVQICLEENQFVIIIVPFSSKMQQPFKPFKGMSLIGTHSHVVTCSWIFLFSFPILDCVLALYILLLISTIDLNFFLRISLKQFLFQIST